MKALILGVGGQDGSYLAEFLLERGYEVHGVVRRNSVPEHQESRVSHLAQDISTYYGDMTDFPTMMRLLDDIGPDEIYNLAAQSHVRVSFDIPTYTGEVNALAVAGLLEAVRLQAPMVRLYQASSSEMFGTSVDADGYQRESTPMHPASPYGCAKLYAYHMVRTYRDAYGLFAANGILFNHESPRRGSNFVTNKIVQGVVRISLGRQDELRLGNLDSYRDWGHSADYVRAMHMMLQHPLPGDFVISTGETRSVRDLCAIAFGLVGLEYRDYVVQDPRYLRAKEVPMLRGDSSKARAELGWTPRYTFEHLIEEMLEAAFARESRPRRDP